MRKLFLLEDDLSLISGLTFAFKKQGFALDTARTLAEAEVLWSDGKYDLLVLDVSLPDGSGFDFCQKVRRTSNVPILFLTASDEEMNIIMGLELGGDDYLTKPFKLGVLLSRVNALLRRANASSAGEPVLESGSITVRLLQGQAYKNGILLELTSAEYKLLCFFMQHPNEKLSEPDPDFCQGTQTAEPHDDFVHRPCGVSGHGGVQYGRYGDSDGNLKPAEQKRKLAYHGKGHLP